MDIGSHITRTVVMGADYYESPECPAAVNAAANRPRIGIGKRTRIDEAIVDKNARIGDDCVITPHGKPETADHPLYYIRDGIVIIPKDTVVPNGTVIWQQADLNTARLRTDPSCGKICPPASPLAATSLEYVSLGLWRAALHLDPFEQPGRKVVFR